MLLLFTALVCGRALDRSYRPSAGEEYYRTIMLKLEGPCTREKETLILSEQEKNEEAFAQIEQIDNMIADGSLSRSAGELPSIPFIRFTSRDALSGIFPIFRIFP